MDFAEREPVLRGVLAVCQRPHAKATLCEEKGCNVKILKATFAGFFVLASMAAAAGPIGMVAAVETGATDMLEAEDEIGMYVQPELIYALGATGISAGLAWEIPFYPQPEVGTLEGRLEF
jgi:hypothetical protein